MNAEKKRQLVFGGISLLVAAGLGTLIYYQHEGMEKRRALYETELQRAERQQREAAEFHARLLENAAQFDDEIVLGKRSASAGNWLDRLSRVAAQSSAAERTE